MRYLNKQERTDLITLATFVSFLEGRIAKWDELNRSKAVLKFARMARAFADRLLTEIFRDLDRDEFEKVRKDIPKYQIAAMNTLEAIREYQKLEKLDSVTHIDTDEFLDLVEQAVCVCQVCKKSGGEISSCNIRSILSKYNIEPLDVNAPEGKCQYQY